MGSHVRTLAGDAARLHPPRMRPCTNNTLVSAIVSALALGTALTRVAPLAAQAQTSAASDAPTNLGHAYQLATTALRAGDQAGVRRILRAARSFAPDDPIVLYYLARAEALTGEADSALATLERLAHQGAARDLAADSAFAALRTGAATAPRFQAALVNMSASSRPIVRSDTTFVLPNPDFIPEGIAWDAARRRFFVGSLRKGGVVAIGKDGRATPFIGADGGLDEVLGMTVDARRGRLWLAMLTEDSTAPRFMQGSGGWAALHAYDLRTGARLARHVVPDSAGPHLLNDIAIAPNGDLYVTDSEARALWRLRNGANRLERVVGDDVQHFTYPNGVAVSADGRRLYVAHAEGLSTMSLAGDGAGRLVRVTTPAGTSAGGIDGLYACGDGLLGVQRLLDFQQVTRFRLSPDGLHVTSTEALERRHPAHDAATTGVIANGAFTYLANAQLGRLRSGGATAPRPPGAAEVRSVALRLPVGAACEGASRGVTGP
jgi:sugar lactone lactonase YvrE